MLKINKLMILIILFLASLLNLSGNNSHLIMKVENMINTDDTFYITNFIESNKDYRNLGPFYEELLDSLAVHKQDLEYFVLFARAGVSSLLDKAQELQYSNRSISDKLKRSSVQILNKTIDQVYEEWLDKENHNNFLMKNALDLMKLNYRINNQLQNDLVQHYYSYLTYGEIYLALNEFSAALEYFKGAKDISSQLETQEYADIADVYILLAESNSFLTKDSTIFDYAKFITGYHDYRTRLNAYKIYVSEKENPDLVQEDQQEEKMDAMNVTLAESKSWLERLSRINNRIFGEYNFIKLSARN